MGQLIWSFNVFSRYLHEVDAEPNELSNSATDVEALSKSQTSLSKCFYTH
jgi:hypothetical protein